MQFKRSFFPNSSLSGKFYTIALLAIVMMVFFTLWFVGKIYQIKTETTNIIHLRLETQVSRLEKTVSDTMDYTGYLISHIGVQIIRKSNDAAYIEEILTSLKTSAPEANEVLSSSLFTWVDGSLKMAVSSNAGVVPRATDLSKRSYFEATKIHPGVLQLGSPVGGYLSGQWVIPAALGITNDKGNYLGMMLAGIDIANLTRKMEASMTIPGVSFAIIDNRDRQIIANSANYKEITLHNDPTSILSPAIEKSPLGRLSSASIFDKNSLDSSYLVSKYPYTIVVSYDKALSNNELVSAAGAVLWEFICIAGLMAVLLYTIQKQIIAPIVKLSNIAVEISYGKKDINIPESTVFEINNLAKQLTDVIAYTKALDDAHAEVRSANESLEHKVTERTSELQKALEVKTEFLNNVSHELRTPVHGVMNFSEILVEDWDRMDDAMRIEIASDIHHSSNRLHSLVSDLLDLSKYKAGKMLVEIEEADLETVVASVLSECKPLYMNKKHLTLKLDEPEVPTLALFDKSRIAQVIRNLVANAIKFTDSGTITASIKIGKLQQGRDTVQGLIFSLRDEGKGIPENEINEIFLPFTQSTRTKTGAGGTGLGLSISTEIIESHQGHIWAENNKDGIGATFSFIIPLASEQAWMQAS